METNPYAPSASSLQGGAPETVLAEADGAFRDLSGFSNKLALLLLIGAGWHILSLISAFMQYHLLSHPPYTMAQANANDLRARLLGVGQLLLFFGTGIVFLRWIYLAQKNLPELEARHLTFTPAWSVGSFFVPLVNIWSPYGAMRDLAKASRSPSHWQLEDTPAAAVAWWALWLIAQVMGNVELRMAPNAHTVPALLELTIVAIAHGVVSIPLYFLARVIVQRVWRDQKESRLRLLTI
jgi:hypothetical protein